MIALKSLRFFGRVLRSHPLDVPVIVGRRLREGLGQAPSGLATTWFDDVRYDVDMSFHRITRKYYFHTHEMYLEHVFRRYLKPGDVFVDIGANMAYWSALALARVGRGGEVHAFEPVPAFFESVKRLKDNNPAFTVFANRAACGAAPGVLPMAVVKPTAENYDNFDTNIGSSSILPGFLDHERGLTETIEVPITPFDAYAQAQSLDLDRIGLIKIDVEGYESYCFDGMTSVLEKPGRKVPILCEVLTDRQRHEKLDGAAIIRRLEAHGYRCFDATTLLPMNPDAMDFEENILCLDAREAD